MERKVDMDLFLANPNFTSALCQEMSTVEECKLDTTWWVVVSVYSSLWVDDNVK